MYPRLEININKLKTNLQVISNLLKKNNLSLAMVTKAYCANMNIISELVKDNKIHLGCLDSSHLLEWRNPNVQSFIRSLLRYAVLRDGFRAEYKK